MKSKKILTIKIIILLFISCLFLNGCINIYTQDPLDQVLDSISEKYISANVKIVAKKGNNGYDGSGVIFKKEQYFNNGYNYYCLTNNHVVIGGEFGTEYQILDHKAGEHKAQVVCCSDEYDLAVIMFRSDEHFEVLSFSEESVKVGDKVISLGNPLGSLNSVTIGKITSLEDVVNVGESDGVDYSNVNFPIITHDAKINSGSSGGALISYDFKIVGINFATGNDKDTHEFVNGYAVPHEKVKEFLTLNKLTY